MTATADNIWRVPAYLPYLQPPVTDEAIAEAEAKIGFSLPSEFLDLLRKQNGGYIRFSLLESPHDTIAGIGPHFPPLTDFDWDDCQEYVGFPLHGLVPFDGDGHWHMCLDYRANPDTPSVSFVDIECDNHSVVAGTFAEYLAMLQVDVGDDFVIEDVPDIDSVISKLSESLAIDFEAPDSWAHGYPTHRAKLGTEGNPEWLWISPNRVIRGFVRPDDSRYENLKDLMPGYGLRYPELPESSFILGATDGVRNKVLDACTECEIAIRPLSDIMQGI